MHLTIARTSAVERDVDPLELFFDLVYVFALGQLSHSLLEHVGLRGGLETTILVLTFGGPALFLLAQVVFLRNAHGSVPRSRPLGVVALAVLAFATAPLTLVVGIAASSAVLVAVAVADTVLDGAPGRPAAPRTGPTPERT
jgi:low temperature requirement protein LtrA